MNVAKPAEGFGAGSDAGDVAGVVVSAGAGAAEEALAAAVSPAVGRLGDWLTEGEPGGCEAPPSAGPPELHPAADSSNSKPTPMAPNLVIRAV
ncbi:hypothetical protein ACIP9X_08240 [Arthrobacter sp. NPDC093125]|uniref:hypothetical protein n=1 Tax=Arthrobacter sp. NPDC093125 TaxID=3363944 RepID=UPI00382ABE18